MYLDSEQTRNRLRALAELEERLSFRIARLSKLLDNHAARQLTGTTLNLTSYRILMVLDIFKETSAADLARLMVIDRAQVSRSVGELISKGLLAERQDPSNKRRKLLHVTAAGEAGLAKVRPHFQARQKMIRDLLDPGEMAGLVAAIDKLSRHLAQELDHDEAIPASGRAE